MLSDKREKKTMKKKILVLAAALGLISNNANAQYLTAAGQSYINRFSVAPAFAGFNENAEGFVGYRSFMAGIEGATKLLTADANGRLGENMGFGVQIINEKSGNFNNIFAGLTYAYHLKFSDDAGLSFAVTPSLVRSAFDLANAKTFGSATDPILSNEAGLSGTGFDAGFSLMFHAKEFYFSVYAPRLICQDLKFQNGIINTDRQIFGALSYTFQGNSWEFTPAADVCYGLGNSDLAWRGSFAVKYNKRAWINLSYCSENWIGLGAGFSARGRIAVNYQYELGTSDIAKSCNGTHEVSVGFLISKAKTHKEPTIFYYEDENKPEKDPDIQKLKDEIQRLEGMIRSFHKGDKKDSKNPSPKIVEIPEEKKDLNTNHKWEHDVTLECVSFADKAPNLNPGSYYGINYLITRYFGEGMLQKIDKRPIMIIVEIDASGSRKYNFELAQKRAKFIKDYLVSKGIPSDKIEALGRVKEYGSNAINKFENNKVIIFRDNLVKD